MDFYMLEGLYKCINKLSEDDEFLYHIHNELPIYKRGRALQEHYECRDLIVLNGMDDNNKWIMGELDGDGENAKDELVFDDDVLTWRNVMTWRNVISTTETAEPLKKEKEKGVVEEEDADEPNQDEGEEEYNSSSNGSDEDNVMELQEDEKITNKI
ncbi:hypothetical protein CR513_05041, partial [Mucuna pruriens]